MVWEGKTRRSRPPQATTLSDPHSNFRLGPAACGFSRSQPSAGRDPLPLGTHIQLILGLVVEAGLRRSEFGILVDMVRLEPFG